MQFKELRKLQKLASKRHPMYEKNRFSKFFIYFMIAFWAAYLILFGILFKAIFEEEFPNMEPYHMLNKGISILLILDFLVRFSFQKPPSQEIKPYLLLPIGKKKILNFLLSESLLNSYNCFFFFLIIPFGVLTIIKFYNITGLIYYVLGFWLLILANNYWYLLCRMLINIRTIYVILPILTYALLAVVEFTSGNPVSTFTMNLGEGFIEGKLWAFIITIAFIASLWLINNRIMMYTLYAELAKTKDTKIKNISEYKFLDRYGEIGEYFRLELKMVFRNKRCKYVFFTGVFAITAFTALLLFAPDEARGIMGVDFICFYNFCLLGLMLIHLMSFEGNYLDGLMSRKQSIYVLLRAKYYFYALCILIPLIELAPAIIMGKVTFLMAISYAFFTTGFTYWMFFQMAVYNNKTAPLNDNLTGKQSTGSAFQFVITLAGFGLPLIISNILKAIFGDQTGLWLLLAIGISMTLLSHLWIKNVYNRFMKRRYINMEGFRNTR